MRFESAPNRTRSTLDASDAVTSFPEEPNQSEALDRDSKHINLFEGWNGFQMNGNTGEESGQKDGGKKRKDDGQRDGGKNQKDYDRKDTERNRKEDGRPEKKSRKEEKESVRVPLPEDEKYRLGYGVACKDVKKPWYLSKNWLDEVKVYPPAEEKRSNHRDSSGKTDAYNLRACIFGRSSLPRKRFSPEMLPVGKHFLPGLGDIADCAWDHRLTCQRVEKITALKKRNPRETLAPK